MAGPGMLFSQPSFSYPKPMPPKYRQRIADKSALLRRANSSASSASVTPHPYRRYRHARCPHSYGYMSRRTRHRQKVQNRPSRSPTGRTRLAAPSRLVTTLGCPPGALRSAYARTPKARPPPMAVRSAAPLGGASTARACCSAPAGDEQPPGRSCRENLLRMPQGARGAARLLRRRLPGDPLRVPGAFHGGVDDPAAGQAALPQPGVAPSACCSHRSIRHDSGT